MADLDDFFAKKDKKKKAKKGPKYSKANTDVLAKNLLENERKEESADKKAAAPLATSEANKAGAMDNDQIGVSHIKPEANNQRMENFQAGLLGD